VQLACTEHAAQEKAVVFFDGDDRFSIVTVLNGV